MAGFSALVVLVLLAGATVAVITLTAGGGGDSETGPYVVPPVTTPPRTVDPNGAAVALTRLTRAMRDDDRHAAVALAGADHDAGALLGAMVDTVAAAHLGHLGLRYVDEQSGLDASGRWTAAVATTWEFTGFDPGSASAEVAFTFRLGPHGVTIAGVGGGTELRTPVWMSGPTEVRRTADTLVMVAGHDPALLTTYAGFADRAIPVVRRVVTSWKPRLVVEVPADEDALDRALLEPAGSNAAIAALASSVDGSSRPRTPVHILVNPEVFGPLPRIGAQVVMSHEVTHLATDAYESQAPTWLKEGIADFVALRDVHLPLTQTAGQIGAQVRRDGLPSALPTSADFDPQAPHLGAIYEAAWLVCVTLADHSGQQALLDLYDRTSRGVALGASLRRLFGWSEADLVGAWRMRLSDLGG